jgi:hypothetical protein
MLDKIINFTKSELMELSDEIVSPVLNNETYALNLDVKLKAMADVISDARSKIKYKVKEEVSEIKSVYGVAVSLRNGYAVLDFSKDKEYALLEQQLKERKELLTQAFKLHEKGQVLMDENSEQIPVVPVKSYTEDSIVYSIK